MKAQSALRRIQQIPGYRDSAPGFLELIIMATNSSVEVDGEQDEFLSELIHELITKKQTAAVEARNTAMWLNTFRRGWYTASEYGKQFPSLELFSFYTPPHTSRRLNLRLGQLIQVKCCVSGANSPLALDKHDLCSII